MRLARLSSLVVVIAFVAVPTSQATGDNPPRDDRRELHVVGLYEGVMKTGNEIHGGRAAVTVDRPGKRVTLILSSYSSVTWEIKPKAETTIEKIIVGGYEPQAIKTPPPGAQVVKAFRGSGASPELPYSGYKLDSQRFRAIVDRLDQWSNLEISSYFGTYRYTHESPIVIDSVQDDPRLLRNFPTTTPLAELPDLLFPGVHMTATGNRAFGWESSYGDFTLAGPQVETLKPLPKGVQRLAFDYVNKKHYGIAGHDAVEVDLSARTTKKMDVSLDVPRLSWPADITFDGKRQRILLITSGGGGYLYAFDVSTSTWSVPAEKLGVNSLVHHSKHDCLYGVVVHHGEDGGIPALREFNAEGALIRETALGSPVVPGSFPEGPGANGTQLVATGDYVVAIAAPFGVRSREENDSAKTYIYLIQPRTGKVWVTAKQPR